MHFIPGNLGNHVRSFEISKLDAEDQYNRIEEMCERLMDMSRILQALSDGADHDFDHRVIARTASLAAENVSMSLGGACLEFADQFRQKSKTGLEGAE